MNLFLMPTISATEFMILIAVVSILIFSIFGKKIITLLKRS